MRYYNWMQNRKRSEATEQERLISWAQRQYNKYPELKLLYHVPNGGSRNTLEAANLKRQGVKAGVPDLCLPVARQGHHGLYIEMNIHASFEGGVWPPGRAVSALLRHFAHRRGKFSRQFP